MGIVTDHLIKLVQRQVEEKGVVLWCDPGGTYAPLVSGLAIPDTRIHRMGNSYLALRRQVDDLLNHVQNETPPRLVVYFPGDLVTAAHALDEFAYGGVVMRPGGQSLPLNTSLEVVARHALKNILTPDRVEGICEQIRKGQITGLADLDELAERDAQPSGVVVLIFGTSQPNEVALEFLTDPSHDQELVAKKALPELATLLNEAFGSSLLPDESAEEVRVRFYKHLLVVEFCGSLAGDPPLSLSAVKLPERLAARDACVQLARLWRNRRDLQASYVQAARRVESDYGLGALNLDWPALREVETFLAVEERLQVCLEAALVQHAAEELIQLASARQSGFWSEVDFNLRARWSLVVTAGQLVHEADRIQAALKTMPSATAVDYFERYTREPEPWCRLDTHHRNLERLAQNFDLDPHGQHITLEKLLARARHQYNTVIDALARRFVTALDEARFMLGDTLYQTEVFARHVAPRRASVKTAYVLVDALRFEMARDLAASLGKDWQVELVPAMGTPPTVTTVGMAALLPGAERGIALADAGGGKLAVQIGDQFLRDRKERIKYLSQHVEGLYEVKLESLVPAKQPTRKAIGEAAFVLVTSQEIDLLGEGDSLAQAREFMDSALGKLARAFRVLVELGVKRIVVAADHGYIFADELEADLTLPAPGGQTVDLDRRMWVGKGGQALDNVLRVAINKLNLGGDLELATPYGLACFACSGNKAYFHGGLALQELVIPVLILQPAAITPTVGAPIEWDDLKPGSAKLSTRFYSVQISGRAAGMFELVPPRVRVEVRAKGKPISVPVSASYGFQEATGEVQLRRKPDAPDEIDPDTITVMINSETDQKTVSVLLIDAATDQTLKTLDKVEIAIAF